MLKWRSSFWQNRIVAKSSDTKSEDMKWLTVPELVERLGIGVSKIRRLIEDRHLLGVRIDGVLKVPEVFLQGSEILPELRGTLILLKDRGYTDEEAMSWLLSEESSLGGSPIEALREGRKAEVRRIAQALGF